MMVKILIAALALAALSACGSNNTHSSKAAGPQPEKTVLTGSYTTQRPLTDEDKTLFGTVTAALAGVSYTPESVATQIVAGTNYRFICTAKTAARNPETYKAEIIVFKPLPGRGDPKITDIKRL